ncbi:receptor-type tyrosine-protein phosphatase-like N [Ctenocephalides felis]|uniref:receptor-type tyrosine-protein phosphatase-like N n=1 Tax=Ctenocephalides felis TaxID=7515 RepID=UPI000E6E3720|nr:receptor-type tyrosine-protein phosphatase-like N [Ctenocephalides felis]
MYAAPFWAFLLLTVTLVKSEGNIGCFFANGLCMEELEWCYDDLAFGRCLPKFGPIDEDQLYSSPLTEVEIAELFKRIATLQRRGYGWADGYTQCHLQAVLWQLRRGSPTTPRACRQLRVEQEDTGYPTSSGDHDSDQEQLAYVSFTPSNGVPSGEYADEVYFPSGKSEEGDRDKKNIRNAFDLLTSENTLFGFSRYLPNGENSFGLDDPNAFPPELSKYVKHKLPAMERKYSKNYENLFKQNMQYNTPESFRMGIEMKDRKSLDMQPYMNDDRSSASEEQLSDMDENQEFFINDEYDKGSQQKTAGVYTEGGLVYVPDRKDGNSDSEKSDILGILGRNALSGFKRRERLDVKKPGPLPEPMEHGEKPSDSYKTMSLVAMETAVPVQKKEVTKYHAPHSVDTSYAYVTVKDSIKAWRVGARLVQMLTELLELPQGSLSHPRVDSHEVSFLVEEEKAGMNASAIAEKIMSANMINTLKNQYGIIITGSGVGDKAKLSLKPEKTILADTNALNGHLAGFLLGGIGGAILVAIGAMILIRKHSREKNKLGSLEGPECGSSKDYQDLCRAHMATKNPGIVESIIPQPQPLSVSTRIASLSKESDQNSPSSRSSTSSWSEEPAMTNMDISTGHMVLSYMEDHLRNKDRLDREWGALCRYEAEPGVRFAASAETSLPLNRQGAPLPYDHSRVVLNHLSNAAGLDYINASTISDHDPRAPLYVVAQGPLKETAAHFWQMVWEQGAVVMVMLCPLAEDGVEMCYQYWPGEESEIYHIYEVHLVSEHIWCEDYLVRSFYLKNFRTGETRTVTQFHFLSWPQNGVPASAKTLLEFRRKVNKSYRGRSCPIVVHCSDGAGRSGTYVLLDMVLARMAKGAREIDIAATLEHIRDQRAEMVATRAQFEFVLTAVAEEVHAILKALPANLPDKKDKEKEKEKEKEKDKEKDQTNKGNSVATNKVKEEK